LTWKRSGGERGFQPRHQGERLTPMPIDDKCNPLCPLFKCARNALFVTTKSYRGRTFKVAMCRLTGGECIGGECQYASCRINSLLPNGKCAKALEKKVKPLSDEELFREMQAIEDVDTKRLR